MNQPKRCKQCGILKQIDDYRPYTYSRVKGTQGHMSICKACENINSRYRRYQEADGLSTEARQELDKIIKLYKALEAKGFHTPLVKQTNVASVDEQINEVYEFHGLTESAQVIAQVPTATDVDSSIPEDLLCWLNGTSEQWEQAGLTPEYLQETVYESLKAKYRPQIGIDKAKYVPIYDDTYKVVLNDILRRFDEYEDALAERGENDA